MGMSDARSIGSVTDISDAYDITKKIEIDLGYTPRTARFVAHVSLINIQCSNASHSNHPSKITVCLSEDATGDQMVLTSTTTDLQRGLSDTNSLSGIIRIDGIIALDRADTIYAHVKTDQGSLTIDQIVITYNDNKR